MGADPRVVAMGDPLALKGVLGAATIVVSSRYHALVSAMSQAVPVVATGWSHKYATLLDSFGCGEQLVDPRAQVDLLRARLQVACDGPARAAMVATLRDRTAAQHEEVRSMWREIRMLVDLPVPAA
jgi:colanic acid/amylovoran biosynthesis protein